MQMSQAEVLGFIGSLLMRMMGVLLIVAAFTPMSNTPMDKEARAYIKRQREWYEQEDVAELARQVIKYKFGIDV